jgi:hypothetical protein
VDEWKYRESLGTRLKSTSPKCSPGREFNETDRIDRIAFRDSADNVSQQSLFDCVLAACHEPFDCNLAFRFADQLANNLPSIAMRQRDQPGRSGAVDLGG